MPGLMCVHPHPDDETIACGGILSRYVDEGKRVMVVSCTAGEEGDNLSGIDLPDEEMVEIRRRELAAALDVLGIRTHAYLGYRDSGMAGEESNEHPDSFAGADLDEAAARLAVLIRRFRPDVLVSDDERGTYGHPDHVKSHEVTVRAQELAEDEAWQPDQSAVAGVELGWLEDADEGPVMDDKLTRPWRVRKRYVHALPKGRLAKFQERMLEEGRPSPFGEGVDVADIPFGIPDEEVTTTIDVRPWIQRKRAAIRAHASQIGEDSFFLNMPDEMARDMFGQEHFVLEDGELGAEGTEDDLFADLDKDGS